MRAAPNLPASALRAGSPERGAFEPAVNGWGSPPASPACS